mmetsp:Transcript_35463/g.101006  ORF Transcript_35463/g.101006 Transcript_35463/m.101006 type:complete len:230 (-) Transcript_35463:36-725(-)
MRWRARGCRVLLRIRQGPAIGLRRLRVAKKGLLPPLAPEPQQRHSEAEVERRPERQEGNVGGEAPKEDHGIERHRLHRVPHRKHAVHRGERQARNGKGHAELAYGPPTPRLCDAIPDHVPPQTIQHNDGDALCRGARAEQIGFAHGGQNYDLERPRPETDEHQPREPDLRARGAPRAFGAKAWPQYDVRELRKCPRPIAKPRSVAEPGAHCLFAAVFWLAGIVRRVRKM